MVSQDVLSPIPKNYKPELEIFGTNKPQESYEFFCEIIATLAAKGYPDYLAYFCTPDYIENRQDLLDNFYHFLAFTVVDRRYESICKDNNYKDERYKKSFAECINILNKIATDIIRFSVKFQLGDKCDTEIIKSFFEGEFFKILDKNTFIMDATQKSLLEEVAKTFFLSIRSPELFPRVKNLCVILLQEINRIALFEDVSRCEIRKNRCSEGGSKKKLKISEEQKDNWIKKFEEQDPDVSEKYKDSRARRGIVAKFNRFIRQALTKTKNYDRLNVSLDTTRKLARRLLDSYFGHSQNKN